MEGVSVDGCICRWCIAYGVYVFRDFFQDMTGLKTGRGVHSQNLYNWQVGRPRTTEKGD